MGLGLWVRIKKKYNYINIDRPYPHKPEVCLQWGCWPTIQASQAIPAAPSFIRFAVLSRYGTYRLELDAEFVSSS